MSLTPADRPHGGRSLGIRIDDELMTSGATGETARWSAAPGCVDRGAWIVSWLPSRRLDRNAAITAMVLAETLSDPAVQPGHRLWPHVEAWARELDITADQAVRLLRQREGDR